MTGPVRFPVLLLAVVLLVSACGDDAVVDPTITTTTATTAPRPVGDMAEDLDALVRTAEELRGLEFLSDPVISLVSWEDLAARVRADFEEEVDPADLVIDQAFFELIGILEPEIDLAQAYENLLAEQTAGFYDTEADELVVAADAELTPFTRTIIVHELIHALADQHFGIGDLLDELVEAERYHEAAALQALAEGEATYFQILHLQSMAPADQLAAVTESLEADTAVFDALPEWFGRDLLFPYDQGFLFVESLIADGGINALDQAYRVIPTTVEQIIHPEIYAVFEPAADVDLPGNALLPTYDVYEEGELGEWNLRLYLLDGVGEGDSIIGSAGWGGDDYRILWNGTEVVFLYRFVGDTPRDAEEAAALLAESIGARMAVGEPSQADEESPVVFQGEDYAWLLLDGATVTLVAASDPAAGETLAEVLTPAA